MSKIIIKNPHGWDQILHEVELGVVMSGGGKDIKEEDVMNHVLGYVLALDMTINLELDKYSIMLLKSFDTSCPIGAFIPKDRIKDIDNLDLKLTVNGEVRHDGNTRDLLRKVPYLISYLSKYFTLGYGDLILSGTPATKNGVASVKHGDVIEASLADLSHVKFNVVKEWNSWVK